ncbi:hypothetical protein ACQJ22_26540 [Pseudomonas fragariae (ex Marin et al. 2024)]|uniref:Uncharacterized protein n=2 Tax=Pseudomonas syringae TaxID=317 RepID=A0AAJ4E2W6_PSESX|nr:MULTISPECIES: hypothetical protein [Pseudomonas syringae group]AAY35384.1 hypothetical protein Psyr_0312 [Pseudomonas syringae pv. syringae B728a]AKF43920.1 hypothetical protein PsyrB_01855 [Pseudomonas syringae pv. syringae B301D]EXL31391.1 hypothetical protein PssB301D_02356 [Pseudomonas syringae pv. syringae str. B301D-R]POR64360.1 hypothetical protein BKM10_14325 [Pseudomonas syringae pv. syringae]PYD16218.1 hypothetical protein DND47_12730 [Pseudomonas syringae pv. syringae]
MERYPLFEIQDAIYHILHTNTEINLDTYSARNAANQVIWETQFSELHNKYGEIDKAKLALYLLNGMKNSKLETPKKLKGILEENAWSDENYSIVESDIYYELRTEIKNTKTIGELADLLK